MEVFRLRLRDLGPTSGGSATALITSRAPWSTEEYATEHNELGEYINNDAMYSALNSNIPQ